MARRVVTCVTRILTHYRVPFHKILREQLARDGIEWRLVYGTPTADEALRGDLADLAEAVPIRNFYMQIAGVDICWQPALRHVRQSDLVVIEQANRLLLNYVLLTRQQLGLSRLAFWGHGRNFRAQSPATPAERLKRLATTRVHWWFAYNELSARVVEELGFPRERITNVQNAVDVRQLSELRQSITAAERESLRLSLGLSDNVAVYIGGMYSEKRLDFLISACDLIREIIPDFGVLLIGGGPGAAQVRSAAADRPWMLALGPRFGREKVLYASLAKVFLMPGLVGLSVLDSFALQIPMITTNVPFHSPEVVYLRNGQNGIIIDPADDVGLYAHRTAAVLTDPNLHRQLERGCRDAAAIYTIEEMASRFARGVLAALDS